MDEPLSSTPESTASDRPARLRLGLAFGGGGSRAFSHLGVLRVLQREGIAVDAVSGSSMGAILGAVYAMHPDAEATIDKALGYFSGSKLFGRNPKPARNDGLGQRPGFFGRVKKFLWTVTIAHFIAARRGLIRKNVAHAAIDALFPAGARFDQTALPFACNALDLTHARLETFTSGPLACALKAGTAVGIVYAPFVHEGIDYADAAPVSAVPVRACRELGADLVLVIDIRTPPPSPFAVVNGFDVLSRIEMIQSGRLNDGEVAAADLVVRPDMGSMFWGDFTRLNEAVQAGERAMEAALPLLRQRLAEFDTRGLGASAPAAATFTA